MKKFGSICLIVFLLVALAIPCAAAVDTGLKIYDEADLFTADEEEALRQRALEIVNSHGMDVLIVTIDDAQGKSSRDYADDFYDENGFGLGSDNSGLVLLIDMDNREAYISTCGMAIRVFTDDRLDRMIKSITSHLSNGNYAKGASSFLESANDYMILGVPSNQYNYDTETKERDYYNPPEPEPQGIQKSLQHLPLFLAISIGGSLLIVGIMALNNQGTRTTHAGTYLEPGSFALRDKRDIYIRTVVTQHKINTNTSGSGGSRSSTHSSSGGVSHGGRGGKF